MTLKPLRTYQHTLLFFFVIVMVLILGVKFQNRYQFKLQLTASMGISR